MTSSDCLPSNNRNRSRLSSVQSFDSPVSSIPNMSNWIQTPQSSISSHQFFTPNGTIPPRLSQPSMVRFPQPLNLSTQAPRQTFIPPEQETLDKSYFLAFNMEQQRNGTSTTAKTQGK